ncbi:hypothetical protein KCTCHS21_27350 [Cohnella abietis]|uniref:Uncharacterized protein n=1 Tax=Cohnella abietis TaxID=2507935 RepID=A0A3T1D5E9_9BACL|nr:hypothetical protein KCTCHS21_27350 [Cohnella abietis]
MLVNSVKKTSGLPALLTTCRKTTSVTSSIGASTKNGRGNSRQKLFNTTYSNPLTIDTALFIVFNINSTFPSSNPKLSIDASTI